MSPSRMISLGEAISWFAWDQRFTAEEFLAADRLKVSAGERLLYNQYLKEGKMPEKAAANRVCAPARKLRAVLVKEPETGMPLRNAAPIFAKPWPISS